MTGDGGGYRVNVSNVLNSAHQCAFATLTPLTNPGPSIRYVNLNNPMPASPYLSWSSAATNIQAVIDASVNGDDIIVTDGVYQVGGETVNGHSVTNRVAINKSITVQSVNGPAATAIQGFAVPPGSLGGVRCVYMTNNTALIVYSKRRLNDSIWQFDLRWKRRRRLVRNKYCNSIELCHQREFGGLCRWWRL